MKIPYVSKIFSAGSLKIIRQANQIIDEYTKQGFLLTLRQLYYQFVSRDLLANKTSEYKRLGSIINDGRLAGYIDWSAIEDRTRNLQTLSHWTSPGEIVRSCAAQYRIDRWADQSYRPEVWCEKEALSGVFQGVCEEYDVPYFSCRGYVSQSEMWSAGTRVREHFEARQTPIILHFGDHDPSGIDMSRDIQERLELFAGSFSSSPAHAMQFKRLALTMEQVERYKPPPNPAKTTDSRFESYIHNYGSDSWELDALEPDVLIQLVRNELLTLIDTKKWNAVKSREKNEREVLRKISERI